MRVGQSIGNSEFSSLCATSQNKIDRFIYLSSASVLGLRGDVSVTDDPQATNPYGKFKWEAEKYVRPFGDTCKLHIIRSANVFGFNSNFRDDSVLNHFIVQSLVEKKILIYVPVREGLFFSLKQCIDDLLVPLKEGKG